MKLSVPNSHQIGTKQLSSCTCDETRKQTGCGEGAGGIRVGESNLSALARRPFSGSIRRLQAHSVYHKQRILPAPSENTTQFIAGGCETESRKCLIGCMTFFSVCLENSWSPSLNFLKIVEPVCQGWQRGWCGFIYFFILLLHNTPTFHADEPSAGSIRG